MSGDLKPLRLPPKDLSKLELASDTLATDGWIRLHYPGRATKFTLNEEHRFSPPAGRYQVLYCARDEETAAMEVYGDLFYDRNKRPAVAKSEWDARLYSDLTLPPVQIADLSFPGMTTAKVDVTALSHRSRTVTHKWGKAVMDHPLNFHGLLYVSRFTGKTCVALFEVPSDAAPLVSGSPYSFAGTATATMLLSKYKVALT